jgi:DNA-binding NarL/FixJ family response regulator
MSRPRVLLADDHQIVAEGLRGLLEPEFDLIGIVSDGRQLVEAATRLDPDVVIVDISMPLLNGLDAAEEMRRKGCRAKIVFLTMHMDASYAARALRSGASGFVLKHSATSELVAAVRAAVGGETYVTERIANSLQRETNSSSLHVNRTEPLLTPRQREVLQLFAEGRSAKQVAAILHISTRTAENHKARIMSLLGVTSTSDLVQYALRHGIIDAG